MENEPVGGLRKRTSPIACIILLGAALVFSFRMADAAEPNVLMIAIDDLRPMLGCYGDERAITPHIDKLAQSGMLFERAYCNYAKCGPSRLSLMSGLRPERIGIYSHRESDIEAFREKHGSIPPLSRWFRDRGYEVRSFGKIDHDGWANSDDWSAPPSPGRDREMWEVVSEENPGAGTIIAERTACPVLQSPDVEDDHLFAGRMTSEVIRHWKTREADKPFLFAVGFRRPHLPFVAPRRYFEMHEPDVSWLAPNPEPPKGVPFFPWFNSDGYVGMARKLGDPMPEKMTVEDAKEFNGMEMRSYLGVPVRGAISEARQLELLQAYAACVTYVDAQIGRLMETLEEEGLREDTIVILWSDHGWHLGEHSAWGKMTNYEIANRIPFLICDPRKEPGRTRSLAELVDVYPTLCDLTGIEAPPHLEGTSLAPVLNDRSAEVQEAVYHHYVRYNGRYRGHAVRTDRYRYVRWVNREGEVVVEELYDLDSDPLETRNRATELSDICSELQARLLEHLNDYESPSR